MEKSILFVDDEEQILRSLNRLFLDKDYQVFLANNGKDALKILDTENIDLIISDIKMPTMNGYELLQKVKEQHPKVLRVAFSGYTDNNKIVQALENNLAKLYLFKPWSNDTLLSIIDKIFGFEDILRNKNLLNLIHNLDDLPTLPFLYQDLCTLIEKDAGIDEISKKIEEDQAISSRILRVVNSAFSSSKTGSVKDAIMYLGLSNVKHMVLSNSVFLSTQLNPFLTDLLWKHVNLTNRMVIFIYKKILQKKVPKTYESAGLLHDIGKVVLLNNFHEKYVKIFKRTILEPKLNIADLEKEVLGVNHQEIGAYLLDWWEIPHPIIESALFHHNPTDPRIINKELVSIVHIAGTYSWKFLDHTQFSNNQNEGAFNLLNIPKEDFEKALLELKL
ncbi:HDOD domain-containing protein [Crassaminicella profunda]|uniref:HDOD domain-containing protein n=1 Tax=Crassaminicella profunda TaxID=1286698 RepID=UPI001CA752A8|nr:HDOD domain-containing protein [Crassaminicella profunda]QZY54036.1 HDOD domain-containing protein [Crassaminicella profunda]